MRDSRLGDVIDDFCVKCRRLTNHSIVSLLDGKAAKVRCRTCYSDHDYRNEQAPPSKKDLKSVRCSVLDVSISDGMCDASSGVKFLKPFFRTAVTTSRGALTAKMRTL